jgi:hypothetical protein
VNTYEAVQLAEALLEQPRISAKELRHLLDSGALSELVDAARCSEAYEDDRPPTPWRRPPESDPGGQMIYDTAMRYMTNAVEETAQRTDRLLRILKGEPVRFGPRPITDFTNPLIGP